MPLYEYACRSCGHEFEIFVRPSRTADATEVECPACHGRDAERLLSLFSVDSADTRKSHLQQTRKLNRKVVRDKAMAQLEHEQSHHH